MHIHKVNLNNAQDVHQFVRFPYDVYQDCTFWCPPIYSSLYNGLYKRKSPFFEHSVADCFIAMDDGQIIGRIAAMENTRFNQFHKTESGFFGYFDTLDDPQIAEQLFAAAMDWAKSRRLTNMVGPRGLMGSDTGGVLVEGFEHRAALAVPYNHPYYDLHIQKAGFSKDTDFLSGYLAGSHSLPERFYEIANRVKQQRDYSVKTFASTKELRQWAPRILQVHKQAFATAHTYYPPSETEISAITRTLFSIADPRLIRLVIKGDEIIGFIFAYHDVTAALQRTQGKLFPFGWMDLILEKKRTEWVNVNGVGMLPQYQGLGGNILLYVELTEIVRQLGFKHIEVIQINEKNFKSFSDMQSIGVQWYKRHRGYQRIL